MCDNSPCLSVIQPSTLVGTALAGDDLQWFAVQTRARHEKVVAERLDERGITSFLPLVNVVHRWSDRRKTVELPLCSCYVFAKFAASSDQRFRTLTVNGVLALVGPGGRGTSIPDEQIEAIRKLVQ